MHKQQTGTRSPTTAPFAFKPKITNIYSSIALLLHDAGHGFVTDGTNHHKPQSHYLHSHHHQTTCGTLHQELSYIPSGLRAANESMATNLSSLSPLYKPSPTTSKNCRKHSKDTRTISPSQHNYTNYCYNPIFVIIPYVSK